MTTRKKKRRAAPDSVLTEFLAALSRHEKREDRRGAEREERTTKRIEAWLQQAVGEVKSAVDTVKRYQESIAKIWQGENLRLASVEKKTDDHEARIKALETKRGDDLR